MRILLALQLAVLAAAGCSRGASSRPLIAGEDSCAFCRMSIADVRYGGEVLTQAGRILTFDAVECLASYIAAADASRKFQGVWVADYLGGGMVPADSALFVRGGSLHSPMGRQLTSFAPTVAAAELRSRFGGEVLTWTDVKAMSPTPPQGATAEADTVSITH